MKKIKFFIFLVCIILLIIPSIKVYAEAPDVVLTINPDSLTLYPLEESDVVITLQNDYSQDITDLALRVYGSVNLELSAPIELPKKVSAGSSIAVPIHILRNSEGYTEGELYVELTYKTLDKEGTTVLQQVLTESMEISERKPSALDEIIKIEVSRGLTTLEETEEGIIQITATNLSSFDVTITNIIPDGTKDITVKPDAFENEITLSPYTSKVFTFTATLEDRYHIGEEPLYFTTSVSWIQDNYTFRATQVVPQPVSIEILSDQSEIFKIIGLPTFLFLPGFLFIFTFLFCWKRFLPKVDLEIKVKEVEFWVLAITVSIPLIYLYRWSTDLVGNARQFPVAFGLIDLQCLWILSLVGGILGWLVVIYIRKAMNRKNPLPEDKPLTIIRKLYFNDSGYFLPRISKGEEDYVQFPITKIDSKKYWIVPFILYEFTQKATDEYKSQFLQVIDTVKGEERKSTAKGTNSLYKILRYGLSRKMIALEWNKGESPAQIERANTKLREPITLIRDKSL